MKLPDCSIFISYIFFAIFLQLQYFGTDTYDTRRIIHTTYLALLSSEFQFYFKSTLNSLTLDNVLKSFIEEYTFSFPTHSFLLSVL